MGRKNQQQAASLSEPPDELKQSFRIAKVETINGNNIYTVLIPSSSSLEPSIKNVEPEQTTLTTAMVELPPKFRNSMWIRRNGFVVIDTEAFGDRVNKLSGEIVSVIHEEKRWRKMPYWPAQFNTKTGVADGNGDDDNDDEDSLDGNFNRRRRDSSDDSE